MIPESVDRILELVPGDASVLDVGGWAKPFRRADVVLDRGPYETRGELGFDGAGPERFSVASWVVADICAREPWPFADKQFDFVVCSHTLEDVRDPLWVCSELVRVGRAGYVETPSRLEEQSYGFQGPWVGYGHHHWMVERSGNHLEFVFKHHVMHGRPTDHFPAGFRDRLSASERVLTFFWTGGFTFSEREFADAGELDEYLASFVTRELEARGVDQAVSRRPGVARRALDRLEMAAGLKERIP